LAPSLLDHFIYSFAEEFLPVANAQGGCSGGESDGSRKTNPIYDKALRCTFSLPIATAVVGMESMEQLEKNLAVAEAYKPFGMPPQNEPSREPTAWNSSEQSCLCSGQGTPLGKRAMRCIRHPEG